MEGKRRAVPSTAAPLEPDNDARAYIPDTAHASEQHAALFQAANIETPDIHTPDLHPAA